MEKGIVVGRSSKETYVSEIMSVKGLISVKPDANLYQCMELMTGKTIRQRRDQIVFLEPAKYDPKTENGCTFYLLSNRQSYPPRACCGGR